MIREESDTYLVRVVLALVFLVSDLVGMTMMFLLVWVSVLLDRVMWMLVGLVAMNA